MPFAYVKPKTTPKEDKSKEKGKGIIKAFPKNLNGKGYFKCQGYGHFQVGCPNRRALTIREIKEVN